MISQQVNLKEKEINKLTLDNRAVGTQYSYKMVKYIEVYLVYERQTERFTSAKKAGKFRGILRNS